MVRRMHAVRGVRRAVHDTSQLYLLYSASRASTAIHQPCFASLNSWYTCGALDVRVVCFRSLCPQVLGSVCGSAETIEQITSALEEIEIESIPEE